MLVYVLNLMRLIAPLIAMASVLLAPAHVFSEGIVKAWGSYFSPTIPERWLPLYVPADLTNVVAVKGGESHALALKSDGTVVAWGSSGIGLTNMPADLTNAVAISIQGRSSLALRS